ncbi:pseudouridine kinase [Peptoniphilus asaccharolyticus DSM 20463]|uniref:Pseudouridine kinase n=1 Tax=Peptoniphilus asaccharolyticus DSM 20463 TaxID=573058 RepID=A0A1W1ULU9_PEPAS|nr:carbohydrate kinase [Peptoniphilus asaccharolyticus]MBL7574876.1 winged helix-turn-helix transcriptional regulator [Peptoniphilus asaccharolyticus]SMB81993.1 pseudouridine kinase [Peptoniphilus asaccharolyticus DSM 20463]
MTPRESEIMELIKKTPTISQQEIADILDIKRSSVAVHINNLSKQGYILGRRYIFREEPLVTVIGGANVDIVGYPDSKIIKKDSNPGTIVKSGGGVGRNISENLAKLNVPVSFIGAFGEDSNGELLVNGLKEIGVETEDIFVFQDKPTSTYLAILNEERDMEFAISDMSIVDKLTPDMLFKKKKKIENSNCAVIETNLPESTIKYLLNDVKQNFYIDCVSVKKAKKLVTSLNRIYFLKANKHEAQFLSGIEINSIEDAHKAAEILVEKGVKSVVVTVGENGLVYRDAENAIHISSEKMKIENASGAGDAFMAGYIYGDYAKLSLIDKLKYATACSRVALKSKSTTIETVSVGRIEEEMKNVK